MSEIKGQLLGLVLAIAIFSIVFGAMTAMFLNTSNSIAEKAENIASTQYVPTSVSKPAPNALGLHY